MRSADSRGSNNCLSLDKALGMRVFRWDLQKKVPAFFPAIVGGAVADLSVTEFAD